MYAHYARVFARATALALILAVPPLLGLLYIRETGSKSPLPIVAWLALTLLWNALVITLFVRGKMLR